MSRVSPTRTAAFEFKRSLILKVAAEQFFAKGYTKTKIEDIADALGVTNPFIYYHFNSKLDLLKEVCGNTTVKVAELAEAALHPAGGDPAQRLHLLVRRFVLTVIEERTFMSIHFREVKYLPKAAQDRFLADRRRYHAALAALLEEGRQAGSFRIDDLSVAGQTVTGMMTWVFNWYSDEGPRSAEEVADLLADMVLAAVGAAAPAARRAHAEDVAPA